MKGYWPQASVLPSGAEQGAAVSARRCTYTTMLPSFSVVRLQTRGQPAAPGRPGGPQRSRGVHELDGVGPGRHAPEEAGTARGESEHIRGQRSVPEV